MDAQIYQFKRKTTANWPNGDGYVDIVSGAMAFSAMYCSAMFSFHAEIVRLVFGAVVKSGGVLK